MREEAVLVVVVETAEASGCVDVAVARVDVTGKRVDWLSTTEDGDNEGQEARVIELIDAGIRELRWWTEERAVMLANFANKSSVERKLRGRYDVDVLDGASIQARIEGLDTADAAASTTRLFLRSASASLSKLAAAALETVLERFATIQEKVDKFDDCFEFAARDLRSARYLRYSPSAARVFGEIGPSSGMESIFSVIVRACSTNQGKQCLYKWIERPSVDMDEIRARHDTVERFVMVLDPSSTNSSNRQWLERLVCILRRFQAFESKAAAFMRLSEKQADFELSGRLSLASFAGLSRWIRETWKVIGTQITQGGSSDCVHDFAPLQQDVQSMLPLCDLLDYLSYGEDTVACSTGPTEFGDIDNIAIHAAALGSLCTELSAKKLEIEHEVNKIAAWLHLQRTKVRILYDEDDQTGFPPTGVVLRIARQDGHRLHSHNGKRATIYRASKAIGVWFTVPLIENLGTHWKMLRDSHRAAESELVQFLAKTFKSEYCDILTRIVRRVGELDTLMAYALVSRQHNFVRARIYHLNDKVSGTMKLMAPFNPMRINRIQETNWEIYLGPDYRFLLLEGEEVAEGSPLLYVIGTIALLNQVGCFVPCSSATLPIFDAILLRSGAYDQQLHGLSTFMTEMKEIALIFKNMTPSSLVLIDDLCRGTASNEGLVVAVSTCSHLIERQAIVCLSSQWRELTSQVAQMNHACTPSSELGSDLAPRGPQRQLENQRFQQLLVDCEMPRELIEFIHQELKEQAESK